MPIEEADRIKALLEGTKVIALVGASDNPGRAAHGVMHFLQQRGWRVIPVNPRLARQCPRAARSGSAR